MFEGSTLVGQFIGTKVQIFLPLGAKVQFWKNCGLIRNYENF